MGIGRAQHLPVQHARHDDVAGELSLAAQFLVCVAARDGPPDHAWADPRLFEPAHVVTPASSQTASTMPR